jgi:Response regulators consisting of a CheY-like receiver domain and a winged-helix DNA-binding domain
VSRRTILIVDDEQDVRSLVSMSLELDAGWTVIEEPDATRAVERAAATHPDLILLDVNLGQRDGASVLAELRKDPLTAGIPVIFLTGNVRVAETDGLRALGAGVLPKPFDPMKLAAAIRAEAGWSD